MASYMEIKITPTKGVACRPKEETAPLLILAPFHKPPTIEFQHVRVGAVARQTLRLRNPSDSKLQVEVSRMLPAERGAMISPGRVSLEAQQEASLEVQWRPQTEGSWRDVLQLRAGRFLLLDVVFLFSADTPRKGKKKSARPLSTRNTYEAASGRQSKACPAVTSGGSPGRPRRHTVSRETGHFWQDKENQHASFSPLPGCSNTFTPSAFSTSFQWPDIAASTPVRRETYTVTVERTPDCLTVSNTYQRTTVESGSSGSDRYTDSLQSDDEPLPVDSFSSKLKGIRLDASGSGGLATQVCDASFTVGPRVCDRSFSAVTLSPSDGKNADPPVPSAPVLLEISPPKMGSVHKFAVSCRQQSAKSSLRVQREKLSKVLRSPGVKMKRSARTLRTLKLLPGRSRQEVAALLSPAGVSASRRGRWGAGGNPFGGTAVYETEQWMATQELEYTKWLNALLTPPAQLDCYTSMPTVNVAELWKKSCRSKTLELAPSREAVSSRYNTHYRLERLRQAARALLCSESVMGVLRKVSSHVNKKQICVRPDRLVYKDVGLRCGIVELLLSYNPLWLRICLEALYDETIPLRSNSDMLGLATFIRTRVLWDPRTAAKYAHPTVLNYQLLGFQDAINKFILRKLLFLVYLLDRAKTAQLVGHNPCLFCKNAVVKKSRDVLVTLTREIISKMGDITSYLRHLGYVVTHEQTYLDEYDYAVSNLSQDLRDGVRLTRVMEIILQNTTLSKQLRYPPISLLQKKHNVQVALTALQNEGYVLEDVTVKDIVEGHREKTLSLLWQLIYKFEAPLFAKAAIVIQQWWRSKLQKKVKAVLIIQKAWRQHAAYKNHIKQKTTSKLLAQHKAATIIQAVWRSYSTRKQLQLEQLKLVQLKLEQLKVKNKAATVIQAVWRGYSTRKQLKLAQLKVKNEAASVIQAVWRGYSTRKQLKLVQLKVKNKATTVIQAVWRGYSTRKQLKLVQLKVKNKAAIVIQAVWRGYYTRKQLKLEQLKVKNKAATVIQAVWRGYSTRKQLKLEQLKVKNKAATVIQAVWRGYSTRKQLKLAQLKVKNKSATVIQAVWRGYSTRKQLKLEQLKVKNKAATVIQAVWRGYSTRKQLKLVQLKVKNKATTVIQAVWRGYYTRKQLKLAQLKTKNKAATVFQAVWRGYYTRKQLKLAQLKTKNKAATVFQAVWRGYSTRKQLKLEQLKVKNKAATVIQAVWRGYSTRKQLMLAQLKAKNKAATVIQAVWRGYSTRKQLKTKNKAATVIQAVWRGYSIRKQLKTKNKAATVIQAVWRCYSTRKQLKAKNKAVTVIQAMWRGYSTRKQLKLEQLKLAQLKAKNKAATVIQAVWRGYSTRKQLKLVQLKVKNKAAIVIQAMWRCYSTRKQLKAKNKAASVIQAVWRGYSTRKQLKLEQPKLAQLKAKNKAATFIQAVWRGSCTRKQLSDVNLKNISGNSVVVARHNAAIKIQCHWRVFLQRRQFKLMHHQVVTACVTIQRFWRGYKARKSVVRVRTVRPDDPEKTLKCLFEKSVHYLAKYTSLGTLSHAVITLDTVTRLSPELCVKVCQHNIVHKLCEICSGGNRSEPYVDIYNWSLRILINLLIYDRVSASVLEVVTVEWLVDCVLRIMSAALSTKHAQAVLNCLTVLWLLGSDRANLQAIKRVKDFSKYLVFYCERARRLPEAAREPRSAARAPLPVREPRWTLRNRDRERAFTSIAFATRTVLDLFGVGK
ncbi:abnormal spindle-like microcephaly-associated protein homolog [Bacillus rossius redtenbacheri]|uniref:abnormal spindle-like microcephaly-associated protein homolog n=1 Tax=Bacillus rossius redtenbacheri TaxID=93214 RepID=UPI002FDDE4DF